MDKALDFYNETHPDANLILSKRPVIEDFYKPSNDQKYYEIVVITVVGCVIGYLAYRLL